MLAIIKLVFHLLARLPDLLEFVQLSLVHTLLTFLTLIVQPVLELRQHPGVVFPVILGDELLQLSADTIDSNQATLNVSLWVHVKENFAIL